MAVMKEFVCLIHGEFEGTLPICPANRCDSQAVTQEFRTPVGIRSGFMKRHDAGIRRSAEMYQINDFKTAKAGETSFAGRADPSLGQRVLWGDESTKVLGHDFAALQTIAAKPLNVPTRDGRILTVTRNNAMADAAESAHITARRVPKVGEVTAARAEKGAKAAAQALT
jgi:hypothetical protein